MNSLTIDQASKLLNVTARTIKHWECGATRIPYSAFKLMRIKSNGQFLHDAWEGWTVKDDTLYSPTGRAFKPHELTYIANYFTMARYWLADCNRKNADKQSLKPSNVVTFVVRRSEGSIGLLPSMKAKP